MIPREIERRWTVAPEAEFPAFDSSHEIKQGYLSRPSWPLVVRVRTQDAEGELTLKAKLSAKKEGVAEINIRVPLFLAKALMRLALAVIVKTRSKVKSKEGFVWEIDVFHGAHEGIVIAEIEIPSLATEIETPAFLGQEVTGVRALSNVAMAFNPSLALACFKETNP